MHRINLDARLLAIRLGVDLDLHRGAPCLTYACGCVCVDCLERVRLSREPKREIVQPWETAA